MGVSAATWRTLRRIHTQITDLKDRLGSGPRQLKAGQVAINKLEVKTVEAKDAIAKAKVAADQRQLQLKEREDRVETLKGKLNTANSNKEFQAIKDQMEADDKANLVLQDEILEMLEKIDTLEELRATANENLANQEAEFAQLSQKIEDEQKVLEAELERVNAELAEAEKDVPIDVRADYKRLSEAKAEDAMSEVHQDCCGVCMTLITPNKLSDLRMQKLIRCSTCGAFLFLSENDMPS